jgi:hypothetical protein
VAAASAPNTSVSLFDRLQRDVGRGGAVAVVPSPDGVVAVSLHGAPNQVIVKGATLWLQVDDRARVIWFQRPTASGSDLWLLDLTQPAPQAEHVATGFDKDDRITIEYDESTPGGLETVLPPEAVANTHIEVHLNRQRPSVKLWQGEYDGIFEDQGAANRRAFRRVHLLPAILPRLRELSQRAGRPLWLKSPGEDDERPRIASVEQRYCEEQDLCGKQEPLGKTRFMRVLVQHSCGDMCHVAWQLYDPSTQEFIDFTNGNRSPHPVYEGDQSSATDLTNVWVATSGEAFVWEGRVYKIAGGLIFSGKGIDGGWLGGQYHVD